MTSTGVHTNSFNGNKLKPYVHLNETIIPHLEFSIEFQSNQLIYQKEYTKRQQIIYVLINQLHEERMGNKEISNYLNSQKIKTPTGKDYTRQLIGMYFYKSRKIERRLKHSELKLTNIRFWVID